MHPQPLQPKMRNISNNRRFSEVLSSLEVRTHTALHVLKGAVQKVLGAKWTAGVHVEGGHGMLSVQFERKPTDEEIALVEEEANRKIRENAPVEELEMDRAEAEERFGDAIYDLFPIPSSVKRLKILHIKDWNVNACKEKHTRSTGEVGCIRLVKVRHRLSKGLLEISFDVYPQ